MTNLQRQILYRVPAVGRPKVEAAKAALEEVNPEVEVVALQERVERFEPLVARADVVLDCSDNFPTRHALNRACVAARKPLVSGAAIRFDGQLALFDLRDRASPCYSCLFPEEGEFEDVQCAVMGVLAPLTGVIGSMQAMEAIKLLTGAGAPLNGRLAVLDGAAGEWRTMRVRKDPACAVCGSGA